MSNEATVTGSTVTPIRRFGVASAAADASRSVPPRLRLTRRGRLVFTALAATPLVLAAVLFGTQSGGAVASEAAGAAEFETVTIAHGESLWSVAERLVPNADPRDVVLDILTLNGLSSAQVQPGQVLALPLQYSR